MKIKKLKKKTDPKTKPGKTMDTNKHVSIWQLVDAYVYSLRAVFVVPVSNGFRLIVKTSGNAIERCIDYKTVRSAKIGFGKRYYHAIMEEAKKLGYGFNWRTIPVESDWLNTRIGMDYRKLSSKWGPTG